MKLPRVRVWSTVDRKRKHFDNVPKQGGQGLARPTRMVGRGLRSPLGWRLACGAELAAKGLARPTEHYCGWRYDTVGRGLRSPLGWRFACGGEPAAKGLARPTEHYCEWRYDTVGRGLRSPLGCSSRPFQL
jgi:hypothetical protein